MFKRIVLIFAFILAILTPADFYGQTKKRANNKTAPAKKETVQTSSEVQRQQAQAQKDIQQTEAQIKENDVKVGKSLAELGKLEGEIATTSNNIRTLESKVKRLDGEIVGLQKKIDKNEGDLSRLRSEYLKAVKKMRVTKKNRSTMAFIFSSGSLSQALRRMRYLKEFSSWRERKTDEINGKIADLKNQKEAIAKKREEQQTALALLKTDKDKLADQYSRQETVVAELKRNGEALQSHLQRKQAEARELGNKVSQLIAQEQRKAQEARERQEREKARAAEEARKKAEADAKKAEEDRARRQAEAEKARREAEEKERLLAQQEKKQTTQQKPAATTKETPAAKPAEKPKETQKPAADTQKPKADNASESKTPNYAEARKRTPRNTGTADTKVQPPVKDTKPQTVAKDTKVQPVTKVEAAPAKADNASSAQGFLSMKGKLQKPSTGSFVVVSRFGRQQLPDLPGVEFDNPGIDAQSDPGASARAVFKGQVSGVYLLPGYDTVVIVNHGDYYTVYGNITSPSVKVGDSVDAGSTLGKLAQSDEDSRHTSIHFEVWKNREKLNPLEWLR